MQLKPKPTPSTPPFPLRETLLLEAVPRRQGSHSLTPRKEGRDSWERRASGISHPLQPRIAEAELLQAQPRGPAPFLYPAISRSPEVVALPQGWQAKDPGPRRLLLQLTHRVRVPPQQRQHEKARQRLPPAPRAPLLKPEDDSCHQLWNVAPGLSQVGREPGEQRASMPPRSNYFLNGV